jgi:putative transposase
VTEKQSAKTVEPTAGGDLAEDLAGRVRSEEPVPGEHQASPSQRKAVEPASAAGEGVARPRHFADLDAVVMSLASKGLANSQISAHLAEVYGASVTPESVAKITDRILDELTDWQTRPLEQVYPVIFIDALMVKIRGGKIANRPVHTAMGVTVDGRREVLGLWIGEGGEGAKYWHQVLTEIMNRGVNDVCFLICDGLKGLADTANAVWPQAIVQTCVVHLIRNTFRYGSHNDQHDLARDVRPIYSAPTEQAALERFGEFAAEWGERYPAIIKLWENAWPDFVPFLAYSPDIREVIYTTNAIENLHSRLRAAVRAHNYFQTEEAALKCLYLAIRSFDPTGTAQRRWSNRWKAALNAFAITFEGRIEPDY